MIAIMPRKVRIEFEGACYHLINRGNYRSWIFKSKGARESFLECLKQVCESQGWLLHAWCLMGNHYHLCVETPGGNLVRGMSWLQSVFANRFNRFRKVNGHVFQGRYKAILLDGNAMGPVCHYIHLNPVRAGLVASDQLQKFVHSSFHQLWYPEKRWEFGVYATALDAAGHLADSPQGRRLYRNYLSWLSEVDEEKRKLGFDLMCRGWAKGSKEFKEKVVAGLPESQLEKAVESEASGILEVSSEAILHKVLAILNKTQLDVKQSEKSAPWKIAVARYLREKHLVPNRWLAEQLQMGAVSSVQSLVSRHRSQKIQDDGTWEFIQNHELLD
jgi:putative transposase